MATQKLNAVEVVTFLSTTHTVTEIAKQFSVTKATANKYLVSLLNEGKVTVTGTKPTGSRGRPCRLYSVTQ